MCKPIGHGKNSKSKMQKHRKGGAYGGLTKIESLSPEQVSIVSEAEYITRRAQQRDSRVVALGEVVLFSTSTGDAWMLDIEDGLALCLARDGEPQEHSVFDNPTSFGIEWNADYSIDEGTFVVAERSGTILTFPEYPIQEVLSAMERFKAVNTELHRTGHIGGREIMKPKYTQKQGQYLAFIHYYTKVHRCPPAEADMQRFFRVTPPSVHQMVLTLEKAGLIERIPGKPRSIRILLPREEIPELE